MDRMPYSVRCTFIIELAKRLRSKGSWCGETHIQKAMFIAQDLAKNSLGYKFIMYKYGPYSFDLKEDLAAMRASELIEFEFPREEYGPRIVRTKLGKLIYEANKDEIRRFDKLIDFVASWLATSNTKELERLATAYFVTKKNPRGPLPQRAKRLNDLKPHVGLVEAEEALKLIDSKKREAKQKSLIAA